MPRLLTLAEAAEVLRLSKRTVYRKARRGELPFVRVGWEYRIRTDDLERHLDRSRPLPAATPSA